MEAVAKAAINWDRGYPPSRRERGLSPEFCSGIGDPGRGNRIERNPVRIRDP